MPWCPKCRNEYYEGVKVCADCGCELVDSLEEIEQVERQEKEEEKLRNMAAFQEMSAEQDKDAGADDNMREASEDPETGSAGALPEHSDENEPERERAFRGVYQNYEEKAADNKSSGYTLLGVGTIGLFFVVLCFCGVLKLPLNETTRFMVLGVLGAMFLFFLVMGAASMKNAAKYAKKAESEKELTKELEKWFAEHVTSQRVDEGLFSEEEADFGEEQKYFRRFEKIKELLSERFLNLDEGFVDRFVDQHYQDIFADNADQEAKTASAQAGAEKEAASNGDGGKQEAEDTTAL